MSSSPKKRQRSQGQRQRAKKESAFHQLFTEYQTEMDARNDIQERIYKSARDVIIEVSFFAPGRFYPSIPKYDCLM